MTTSHLAWLWPHLSCPSDPCTYGMGEGEGKSKAEVCKLQVFSTEHISPGDGSIYDAYNVDQPKHCTIQIKKTKQNKNNNNKNKKSLVQVNETVYKQNMIHQEN